MKLRDKIVQTDLEFIREILVSTGFFYDFEVATAVEIGEEVLAKGDAAGYHFLFVEDEDFKPYGFTSFGDIPCKNERKRDRLSSSQRIGKSGKITGRKDSLYRNIRKGTL